MECKEASVLDGLYDKVFLGGYRNATVENVEIRAATAAALRYFRSTRGIPHY